MIRTILLALAALSAVPVAAIPVAASAQERAMLVIAHRGASGDRPEHTLAAYERAIDQGADYIEPDLVPTKDGILVARHENAISATTDVATHEAFADRRRAKTIDGQLVTDWFVEDFTLAELRTLRAKERLPAIRPGNARFDGLYAIPTFAEIVTLLRAKEAETGRTIGIYPELKHPNFMLQDAGIDVVDLLVRALDTAGYTSADDAIFVQSFEVGALQRLNARTDLRLVQLMSAEGGPADEPAMRYTDMATPSGLAQIAQYADGIGVEIAMVAGRAGSATPLTAQAHEAGLSVHAWTLRKENMFLPEQVTGPGGDTAQGCDISVYATLSSIGVDGVFTDDPGRIAAYRDRNIRPAACGD